MRIAVSVPTLSPQGGGVPPVIQAHCRELQAAGETVGILTLDQCKANCLSRIPGLGAWGVRKDYPRKLRDYAPDLIHVHGLWMYHGAAAYGYARKNHIPLLVSPHGMLDPWALEHSQWKKLLMGVLFDRPMLRYAKCIHALCESEYESIRAYGLKNPVAIIPNGIDLPASFGKRLSRKRKRLLFLGRLHPKKGIPALLQAWSRLHRNNSDAWQLIIAGWDQNGHGQELKTLCHKLKLNAVEYLHGGDFGPAEIAFVGARYGEEKAELLRQADAFILPSLSEGLPMAVLEAWAAQLPCLLTPQCHLPIGFEANAALRIEPDADSIHAGLIRLFSMPETERLSMGCRARALVQTYFSWFRIGRELQQVYHWCNRQGERPECVRIH